MTGNPKPTYTDLAGRVLGLPYREGGASPEEGFDCAGLALWVLRELGFDPPEGCMDGDGGECWEYIGEDYRAASKPGDILVSDSATEIASDPQGAPVCPHVSVMVLPDEFLCLACSVDGGVFATKSYAVSNLVRVVRLR